MKLLPVLLLFSITGLAQPRLQYGKQRLAAAAGGGRSFVIKIDLTTGPKESFLIDVKGNTAHITGADASGALYGCLTLADEVKAHGWPATARQGGHPFHLADHPRMDLR